MNKGVKEFIHHLQVTEGEGFSCDEQALENYYKEKEENNATTAIKILSVVGGVFASLLFLGFLALAGLFNSSEGMTTSAVIGGIAIAVALFINQQSHKIITDTFSITLYGTGLILMAIAFADIEVPADVIALLGIIIGGLSLWMAQNYILSFVATVMILGCVHSFAITHDRYSLTFLFTSLTGVGILYLSLHEASIVSRSHKLARLYSPVLLALTCGFLGGLIGNRYWGYWFPYEYTPENMHFNEIIWWVVAVVTGMTTLYTVHHIMNRFNIPTLNTKILLYLLSICLLAPATYFFLPITGSLLIVLLSFMVNARPRLILGILCLLYALGAYYYTLEVTLLTKSLILLACGVLFLLFYGVTVFKTRTDENA